MKNKWDELEAVVRSYQVGGAWPKVWERGEVILGLIADVKALAEALTQYANPDNWEEDENGIPRIWLVE